MKIELFSWAANSVSSDNLSAFDVIGSKACKIIYYRRCNRQHTAVDIVTNQNEVSCQRHGCDFKAERLCHQMSVVPYSTDHLSNPSSEYATVS